MAQVEGGGNLSRSWEARFGVSFACMVSKIWKWTLASYPSRWLRLVHMLSLVVVTEHQIGRHAPTRHWTLVIRMLLFTFLSGLMDVPPKIYETVDDYEVFSHFSYFYPSQVTDSRYASPDQDQWSGHLQSEGLFLYTTILTFLSRFGNDRRWSFSSIFLRVVDLLYLFYPIMSLCFVKYEHASTLTMYSHFFAFGL